MGRDGYLLNLMQWAIILFGVVIVVLIVMLGYIWHKLGGQQQQLEKLQQEMRTRAATMTGMGKRIKLLDSHLQTLEQQQTQLAQKQDLVSKRQDKLNLQDPGNMNYQQAIALVKKGVSIEELINTCGCSRGEAELLIMMHGVEK